MDIVYSMLYRIYWQENISCIPVLLYEAYIIIKRLTFQDSPLSSDTRCDECSKHSYYDALKDGFAILVDPFYKR